MRRFPELRAQASAMGKKLKESSSDSEPVAPEAILEQELKCDKKKKKKKEKHGMKEKVQEEVAKLSEDDQHKSGIKRKKKQRDETDTEIETKSKKKEKKKHKKGDTRDSSENGSFGAEEEVRDGNVVVSGKDVKNPKYAAVKSFESSKLPGEVLECCKGFKEPSPIQSRAWPFLLNGRDFIGIAATGSGRFAKAWELLDFCGT